MILRSLWFRPLLARPLRLVATTLGVALGVASVVSTVLASHAAVASLGADVDEIAGAAVLELRRPGGVALADLASIQELCAQALFVPVIEDVANLPRLGDLARVLGVDLLLDGGVRSVQLDHGALDAKQAFDRMLLGRGAALAEELAAQLGLQPGDRLEAIVGSRAVQLEVAATFRPERFASAWERVILVDVATAQELFERTSVDRIEVLPRGTPDVDALAAQLAARLPDTYHVAPSSERRSEGERMVRALRFNLTALSGVSLLVGLVLVATTLATSVVQRRQAIALLRSLGASRAQLAGAVLVEAGAIGALGGLLGVFLGWGAAHLALDEARATVATITPAAIAGTVAFEGRWLVFGVAAGLVVALLAALLPLREAIDVPPIQGLRRERPETRTGIARRRLARLALALGLLALAALFARLPPLQDRPIWALASALLLLSTLLVVAAPLVELFARVHLGPPRGRLGTPLRLAQAALAAGRVRAGWAAGAVGVAIGLAIAMGTMVGSFRQTVVEWTETTMRSDLFVRTLPTARGTSTGGVAPEVADLARELFGPGAVDAFHAADAYVQDQLVELGGAELEIGARVGGVPFLDGRTSAEVLHAAHVAGEAVVNEPFARRFGVERGSTVSIETAGGIIERRVAGVYQDYSGHMGRIVIERADLLEYDPEAGIKNLEIFLPAGSDASAARDELLAVLDGRFALEVLLNREVRNEVLAVFERTFAVTVALQLLAVAVAAIAVVTVLGSLVWERRRDLAIVRVLGGSALQLVGVVLGKALLLGTAGALGGVTVGLLVGYVLVAVVNVQSFGWSLRFLPPWGWMATTVGLVVPACLIAGLPPALLALRRAPGEDLRELA